MKNLTAEEQELLTRLGKRIKKLRQEKGYTNYEHFAYEHGISRTQYGKYETGENIKFITLVRVLKGLDVSLKDFFSQDFQ